MFKVLECIAVQHDRVVVAIAAAISLAGMTAFALLIARSRECEASRRPAWLALAAVVGGLGVWATHFVAMLAYRGSVPLSFDVALTVLSAVAIIAGLGFSLWLRDAAGRFGVLAAAAAMTAAIAAMHFIGMGAIDATARVSYDVPPIAVGAVGAWLLLAAGLHFANAPHGRLQVIGPALFGVLAVCTLHFTAMSATLLVPDPLFVGPAADAASSAWLVGAIAAAASVLTLTTTGAVVIDRYLTDLKGFADATLDGIAIVRDGRIVEANGRFVSLLGGKEGAIVGEDPDALLAVADGQGILMRPESVIEAAPRHARDRTFEVGVHTIEYRGRPSQVLAVRDLTEKRAAQRQIEHMARHDALTDLPNRTLLSERLDAAVARAATTKGSLALLVLDLDRFKAVNDIFGHAEGDAVLKQVADILRRAIQPHDTVARIGGDEFVILQAEQPQPYGARLLVARILEVFAAEMNVETDPKAVGVSIGVAFYPEDAPGGAALFHAADVALYRSKSTGRGNAVFYSSDIDSEIRHRRALEADLHHAVQRRELRLACQPLCRASDNGCVGYEALLRWVHPVHGMVPPDVFIPIAEESGSIFALGEWVLREACATAVHWPDDVSIAVNVSPVQFRSTSFASVVGAILAETGLPPERLELEITESCLMKDRASALTVLKRLRSIDVRIVMDDFGTGYSSLSNLQSFPFDKIKIDRSFIAAMDRDRSARAIVRAIAGLGRSLGIAVVAEGVETAEQRRIVVEEGCTHLQGYLFGRPVVVGEAAKDGRLKGSA
ncbi:bifunctional diguanylate cyclase/phosphodiesterase [Methylobrevis albus]|uniref:EAL domain-containing protein n=1 Tax=Methylobrevis albus TaxID=2793297 RepID=A0A931I374_9HYPH|nr:EAL domain-containing protein [Methylobrevis albus]MBH0238609.1 EAL domain-containing protein [Methylobrevis albus]